jgi:hypothetical protein
MAQGSIGVNVKTTNKQYLLHSHQEMTGHSKMAIPLDRDL